MSEEEIHKALEIIKQPITVNCKDYYYFDQENYNNLVSAYDNCLWFIRNFEQINTTVERLQQENRQLKERHYLIQGGRGNCKTLVLMLQKENDKYKSVLDEIREQLKLERKLALSLNKPYTVSVIDKISDKVKE